MADNTDEKQLDKPTNNQSENFSGEIVPTKDTEKFELLSNDGKLIKEYANLAKFKRDVIINYIRQMTNLQNRIPTIIQFLEKEYHLN